MISPILDGFNTWKSETESTNFWSLVHLSSLSKIQLFVVSKLWPKHLISWEDVELHKYFYFTKHVKAQTLLYLSYCYHMIFFLPQWPFICVSK